MAIFFVNSNSVFFFFEKVRPGTYTMMWILLVLFATMSMPMQNRMGKAWMAMAKNNFQTSV